MLKTFYKKLIVAALVTLMILSALPMAAFAAVNKTINGVEITTTGSNDSSSNTTVTAQATTTSGCNGNTTETNTVTIKNKSGSSGTLSFSYTLTLNGGTVKIGNTAVTSSGTYSAIIENDASITVTITSPADVATTKVEFGNFSVVDPNASRTITINGATGGTVKCGSVTVNAGESKAVSTTYSTGVTLTATAANGYAFGFWKDASGKVLSYSAKYTVKPTADMTVSPVFSNGGFFMVGSTLYFSLSEAIAAASNSSSNKVIITYVNSTVPAGNYTIPNGVTLLVPFDEANTIYTTEPEAVYSHSTPSPYRILTLADGVNITVANGGKICVPSKISGYGQNASSWNGTPTGKHGRIHMDEGSSITLQSGAALYCYGYISGSGSVTAKSGSTVWEAMQFRCWRGGTASSNMQNGVFPMSQYYVQNVEAPLTLESGSTEKVFVVFNASSTPYSTSTTFIGSGGMFVPSGSVTKRYDSATDRLIIDVNGNLSVSALSLSLKVSLFNVNLNTSNYDSMPINSNITVHVHSGTTTVNQSLGFLPGSELSLDQGAVFSIASGKKVFVYDKDEWGPYACDSYQLVPVGYSTANGTTAKRTEDDLVDAKLDINGTVNISGYLYTTESGANIISSKKTGKIVYNTNAPSNTTTQQATQSGTDITKVNINITSAQLHNGNGSYTATSGSNSGDYFAYSPLFNQWKKNYDVSSEAYLDINEDGSFDMGDISLIVNYSNNNDTMTSSQQSKADLNHDGVIDEFDAAYLDRIFYPDPNGYVDGDVDQDGDVDLTDYTLIRDYMSGVAQGTSTANLMAASYLDQDRYAELIDVYGDDVIVTQQYYTADVNYDKAVDAFDLFIVDKINNNIV